MSERSIHVRPRPDGSWAVEFDETHIVLSVHDEAHDATLSAAGHAHDLGIGDVVVHDRYHGVHTPARADIPCGHVPSSGTRD